MRLKSSFLLSFFPRIVTSREKTKVWGFIFIILFCYGVFVVFVWSFLFFFWLCPLNYIYMLLNIELNIGVNTCWWKYPPLPKPPSFLLLSAPSLTSFNNTFLLSNSCSFFQEALLGVPPAHPTYLRIALLKFLMYFNTFPAIHSGQGLWILYHFIPKCFAQCRLCLVTQSCPTLCYPMDCKPARLLCSWGFFRQDY